MELEFDKEELEKFPIAWSKELVIAVCDYKDGKKNSEKELRKFVNREISEHYYNELIEMYGSFHRINKEKKERERKRKIKRGFCSAAASLILLSSFAEALGNILMRYGKGVAFWYFFLWFWAFYFAVDYGYEEARKEITSLKWDNEHLKDDLTFCKNVNKELEAKLEDINNASHQD